MVIKKEAIKFLVRILRNKYVIAGVPAIIINQKKEILLGKRDKGGLYPSTWGLPGGIIEYGESMNEAIKREVKEEIGVKIKIMKYGKPIMNFPSRRNPLQTLNVPIYCEILKGKPEAKDETTEVRWFKAKEIRKMQLAYSHKKILQQERII